jgi:hypothetical protein
MRRASGSTYVAVVLALLVGYFTYQWWFNPRRAIKRQLGELAATLSVPDGAPSDLDRLARAASLRNYFAPDVQIALGRSGPSISSRDALIAAVSAWKPPPGEWRVTFVDVQIAMESDSTARAHMTVEVTSRDPRTGQPAFDAREVAVGLEEQDSTWVVTTAEPLETLQRP